MTDRITREKEYHNKAFSEGVRKAADKYYTIHATSLGKLYEILEKHAKGKKVLEYGCGPGYNSFFLAEHARELIAIDISDFAIKTAEQEAARKNVHNATFLEMNAEDLRFEDESFDLVFGNSIIHHLDLHKSYSEIKRVLKPGAKAVFYEPLGHNYLINKYRQATPDMRTEDEHPLLMKDIKLAEEYFDQIKVSYHHLSTLAAVPFRNTPVFKPLLGLFTITDKTIFTLLPFTRKYAWFSILEFTKGA